MKAALRQLPSVDALLQKDGTQGAASTSYEHAYRGKLAVLRALLGMSRPVLAPVLDHRAPLGYAYVAVEQELGLEPGSGIETLESLAQGEFSGHGEGSGVVVTEHAAEDAGLDLVVVDDEQSQWSGWRIFAADDQLISFVYRHDSSQTAVRGPAILPYSRMSAAGVAT